MTVRRPLTYARKGENDQYGHFPFRAGLSTSDRVLGIQGVAGAEKATVLAVRSATGVRAD